MGDIDYCHWYHISYSDDILHPDIELYWTILSTFPIGVWNSYQMNLFQMPIDPNFKNHKVWSWSHLKETSETLLRWDDCRSSFDNLGVELILNEFDSRTDLMPQNATVNEINPPFHHRIVLFKVLQANSCDKPNSLGRFWVVEWDLMAPFDRHWLMGLTAKHDWPSCSWNFWSLCSNFWGFLPKCG